MKKCPFDQKPCPEGSKCSAGYGDSNGKETLIYRCPRFPKELCPGVPEKPDPPLWLDYL